MADIQTHLPLQQSPVESTLVQNMLDSYKTRVREQINSLTEQIKVQKTALQNQYSSLKQMPYHLHGVCIHDGTAESGHYYSYIKDPTQNIWR